MNPPVNEPTLGEVLRRLDEVARQMADMATQMREDRTQAAATYVRQDVYIAQRQADQAVVADTASDIRAIQKRQETETGFRRQVWLSLAVAAITSTVAIGLAILNLLAR